MTSDTRGRTSRLPALLARRRPLVAASVCDDATSEAVDRAAAAGLDVLELRVDRFGDIGAGHVRATARRLARVPTVATARVPVDGGSWAGDDRARLALLADVAADVDAVDVELSLGDDLGPVVDAARRAGAAVVVSHHDMSSTPPADVLLDLVSRAAATGADLVKLATWTATPADVATLVAVTVAAADDEPADTDAGPARHGTRSADDGTGTHRPPVAVMGMGPFGAVTRVLLPVLGSRLTFARLEDQPSVPGQLSLADTVTMLRRFVPDA